MLSEQGRSRSRSVKCWLLLTAWWGCHATAVDATAETGTGTGCFVGARIPPRERHLIRRRSDKIRSRVGGYATSERQQILKRVDSTVAPLFFETSNNKRVPSQQQQQQQQAAASNAPPSVSSTRLDLSEKEPPSVLTRGDKVPDGLRDNSLTQTEWGDVSVPRHVAFICDGNSRWATSRHLPTFMGHSRGADAMVDTVQHLKEFNVEVCTFFGFSTENWARPPQEVQNILKVMEMTARTFYQSALNERVQVKILGDLTDKRIPSSLREILEQLEQDTVQHSPTNSNCDTDSHGDGASPKGTVQNNEGRLTVCLAVNYGGRNDILNAAHKLACSMAEGNTIGGGPLKFNEQDGEKMLASFLCTASIPDPDLIIRTGGERRLSNFLLWNAAYAELYFDDVLWPDFDRLHLEKALRWYSSRSRRFGGREKGMNINN
uniref:Alkyl transferase n=1 Tax=Attheya septentrionalis TaxID=420275 RepID=A0A7S2ULW0_9STRA|mmetsp:Transcript_27825/g.50565  ORF Transcript_27825/g.50565 Transcript_27825/m.50565 type:complete len:433 (+) Transcript_27825:283-1581(+)